MSRTAPRHVPATILVLVALTLSGCTGTPGDEALRPQSSPAGDETPSENETAVLPTLPEIHVETIDISGRLGTGILVNTAATPQDVVVDGDERFFPLDPAGEPVSIDINLTWDDPKGVFETLRVGFAWGCTDEVCTGYDYVQGGSPLNYVNQTMVGDQATWLFVFVPNSSQAPGLGLYVRSDVEFDLQGELRSR